MATALEKALAIRGLVSQYARMWPRDIFDHPGDTKKYLSDELPILNEAGVYILYRDDLPYYIGKTDGKLFKRLQVHARNPGSRYDYFWNYFSVFVIHEKENRRMVEAILIAAIPTANSAHPKAFDRHKTPKQIKDMIRNQRKHQAMLGDSSG